jgi:hypothetical protein
MIREKRGNSLKSMRNCCPRRTAEDVLKRQDSHGLEKLRGYDYYRRNENERIQPAHRVY